LLNFGRSKGYFAKPYIWLIAADDESLAHDWHKKYSLPLAKVLDPVACYTASCVLGPGEAEMKLEGNQRKQDWQVL
jgi:hypothetical protein